MSASWCLAGLFALSAAACGGRWNGSQSGDGWSDSGAEAGVQPDSGVDAAASCEPVDQLDDYCNACSAARCAPECAACESAPQCKGWIECASDCTTAACLTECSTQFPEGEKLATPWIGGGGCMSAHCAAPCGGGGPMCGFGATTGIGAACDACFDAHCCHPLYDCMNDTECQACLSHASDPSCNDNEPIGALIACLGSACVEDCAECGVTTVGAQPSCAPCIVAHCCAEGWDCSHVEDADHNGKPDCTDVVDCTKACPHDDSTCMELCKSTSAPGADLATRLLDCEAKNCGVECQ